MRYDAEHKQKTRDRVIKEAARAIREDGPDRVAVAGVMARAGLTHGGFYAHFASKDDLVAQAIGQMFEDTERRLARSTEGKAPRDALAAYIDFYLSAEHRDTRAIGCPLPALSADLPRLPPPAREAFGQGVASLTEALAKLTGSIDLAGSVLAELVGALSLARAVSDPEQSNAILVRSRTALFRRLELECAS